MAIKLHLVSKLLNREHVRQIFAYTDSAVGYIQAHFC